MKPIICMICNLLNIGYQSNILHISSSFLVGGWVWCHEINKVKTLEKSFFVFVFVFVGTEVVEEQK